MSRVHTILAAWIWVLSAALVLPWLARPAVASQQESEKPTPGQTDTTKKKSKKKKDQAAADQTSNDQASKDQAGKKESHKSKKEKAANEATPAGGETGNAGTSKKEAAAEKKAQEPASSASRNAANKTPPSGAASANEIASAQSSGKVWVNTDTGVYHKGGRWYGNTKNGKFMTEQEAQRAGYRAAQKD